MATEKMPLLISASHPCPLVFGSQRGGQVRQELTCILLNVKPIKKTIHCMIPIIRHFGITVGNAKKTSGLQGCRDRKIKSKAKLGSERVRHD